MLENKRIRRQFSSEDKASAVKRHVVNGEAISAICEDLGLTPKMFYRWRKEMFDHAAAAFEVKGNGKRENSRVRSLKRQNDKLRAKLTHKDNVIAEITEDYVRLKKNLGED